jgi:hypothetical protein
MRSNERILQSFQKLDSVNGYPDRGSMWGKKCIFFNLLIFCVRNKKTTLFDGAAFLKGSGCP